MPARRACSSSYSILGQIGDQIAVRRLCRRDLREGCGRLSTAAWRAAAMTKLSGAMHSVSLPFCGIGEGAVDAERARIPAGCGRRSRALQHHAAGGGIDPEPAARGGRGFFVDTDRCTSTT